MISFTMPDVRKTLNIINLWHVDNIIIILENIELTKTWRSLLNNKQEVLE